MSWYENNIGFQVKRPFFLFDAQIAGGMVSFGIGWTSHAFHKTYVSMWEPDEEYVQVILLDLNEVHFQFI